MAPLDPRTDPHDLARFLWAQAGIYDEVVEELRAGRKRGHWMWFVFPQVDGLGRSGTARHFAIHGLAEARAYLDHPVLGVRLRQCTGLVNRLEGRALTDIFGPPDHLKFGSSMTLFEAVAGPGSDFSAALDKYCSGRRDSATLALLGLPA